MNPLFGLKRVVNCPKVQVAAAGLISAWFAVHYAAAGLDPQQRTILWSTFIGAVGLVLREVINAWTEEDVAAIHAQSQPPVVHFLPRPPGPTDYADNVAQARPLNDTIPSPQHSSARSSSMPARTKLPILMLFVSMLACAAGCQQVQQALQTPVELVTYREGLHAVDEPLYQAHLLLIEDAVKAGIRTDADRQVVQQGVAAGRSLYLQSVKTQASSVIPTPAVPTTQP
jgi:hypothetical protein